MELYIEENVQAFDLEKRLIRGFSRRSIEANISKERKAGKPQKQAVAIALSTARRARAERRRRGRMRRSLPGGVVSPDHLLHVDDPGFAKQLVVNL